jgi:hypothetical protein
LNFFLIKKYLSFLIYFSIFKYEFLGFGGGMGPHGMLPQSLPPMHAPPMPPMSRDGSMAGMFFGSGPMSQSSLMGSEFRGIQHGGGPSYHHSLQSLQPSVTDLSC